MIDKKDLRYRCFLFRPISDEERETFQTKIDCEALLPAVDPYQGGFPLMPHDPIWNPKPQYYR